MLVVYRHVWLGAVVIPFLVGCVTDNPVSEEYYEDITKIKGQNAPSSPVLTIDTSTWTLTYTQSIDPDTGAEVPYYHFYAYTGLPVEYYKFYDLAMRREKGSAKSFTIDPITQSGVHTIVVTGYDLGRESAVISQSTVVIVVP